MLASWLPAQRPPGGIALRGFTGEWGLDAEMRDEQSRSGNGNSLNQREKLFREIIGLRALGDIYHPALFDFDAGLHLELEQRNTAGSGSYDQRSNSANLYYDVIGNILKEKPVSADFTARRGRMDTRQRFFPTTTADTTDLSADLRFKEIWIPSTLRYENSRYEGHGQDRLNYGHEKWRLEGTRDRDWTSINYLLERGTVDQKSYNVKYDEAVARASVGQRFGRKGVDSARVGGYYREQTGNLNSSYEQANAGVHFQWLPELSSDHDVNIDHSKIDNAGTSATQQTLDLSSSLNHRLYESLFSSVTGRRIHSEYGAGKIDRDQADLQVSYQKSTFFGNLGIDYHPYLYRQDEVGSGQQVPVIDEPHTNTPGAPIVLRFVGIDPATVFITDGTGTILYSEPSDYVLYPINGLLRVEIPVGSTIPSGGILLVDYIYNPSPDKEFRGIGENISVAFEFGDFAALSLENSTERQKLLSGFDDGTLGNSRIRAVRARVYQWDQEISADYEDWQTPQAPYERVQIGALSRLDLAENKRFSATARWYRTRFKEELGRDHGLSLGANFDWRLGAPTNWFTKFEYHQVTYRTDKGTGWMLESGLDFRVRDITMTAEARYTTENFEVASDQDLWFFQFVFRRLF